VAISLDLRANFYPDAQLYRRRSTVDVVDHEWIVNKAVALVDQFASAVGPSARRIKTG
jgi:hypothetical protein